MSVKPFRALQRYNTPKWPGYPALFPDSGRAAAWFLSTQFLLLDFQVDQGFQLIFRRTASVFWEHGHHPNRSAVGNLDTFRFDLLGVVWLVYGREPPFLTDLPVMNISQTEHIRLFCEAACFALNAANTGFAARDSLAAVKTRKRPVRGRHGLFLAGKQIDFFAKPVRQKKHFFRGFSIQVFCPPVTADLPHIGVYHVDAGVHRPVQFRRISFGCIAVNQAAEIGCACQPGQFHVPLEPLILLLCHTDRDISAVVSHGPADFSSFSVMQHEGTLSSAMRGHAHTLHTNGGTRSEAAPLCRSRC